MNRRIVIGLGVLLALAAMAGPALVVFGGEPGSAAFGDAETFGMNELASASVSVEVGEQLLLIDASAMAPGDRLPGRLVLDNDGSLPLRYSLLAEPTDAASPLLDVLDWSVWHDARAGSCQPIPAATLYEGPVIDDGPLIGDPAIGLDAGDRSLAPGQSEVICFVVELPLGTSNAFQGTAAQVDLVVVAEQATEPIS